MKYIFIINPIAGNDDKARFMSRIKSSFRENDDEMIIEETQASGDAKSIAARYAKEYGSDCVVVACGGDGTVHEVAGGLAFTDTPMMVLPFGTGNDFAKKIYSTKDINVEEIISSFGFFGGNIEYDEKAIDLIDYNGEKCINVMSFGMDTLVETIGKKMADKAPFLGHNAYNLAIVPVVMKPLHYDICFDINCYDKETGETYSYRYDHKDYTLFAICNASFYGGGFEPAPNAELDDGLLDFVLVRGLSLPQALPLIPKYSNGVLSAETCPEHVEDGFAVSGRLWMEDGSKLLGNCDGENFDYSEINFKVDKKALKLCVIKD